MGWKGVTVMDQRVRFIAEHLKGYFPFNELCFQFSISRKTGYKWVQRYEEYGIEGLTDRARRPHACPHKTDTAIVEAIVYRAGTDETSHLGAKEAPPNHLPPLPGVARHLHHCRYPHTERTHCPG